MQQDLLGLPDHVKLTYLNVIHNNKHFKLLSTEKYSGTSHWGSNLDSFPFHVCYSSNCLTETYQLSLVVQILTLSPFPPY